MAKTSKSKIINYFLLWGLLSFVSVKIKEIILERISTIGADKLYNPIFSFYEVHNNGAAFNLFTNKVNILILSAVVCTIIITAIVLAKPSKLNKNMVSAMALLSSGMTLNTIERIQTGYVTDYIYFTFFKNFPVFNVPDIMIVIGAIMLAFSLLTKSRN